METVTVDRVNQKDTGVKFVGEDHWVNYSKSGYEGPRPLVEGQQYEVEVKPWNAPDGTVVMYLNSAKPVGEAVAQAPSPYQAAEGAARQAVTATAKVQTRDRHIDRMSAIKSAVDTLVHNYTMLAQPIPKGEILALATEYDDWIADEAKPPSEALPVDGTGHVVPVEQQQQEPPRYSNYGADGDPGPGQ